MMQVSNAEMSDGIIKKCLILKDMYHIESIRAEIKEVMDLKKNGQLRNKLLIKNYDQIKIVGEILEIISKDLNSLNDHRERNGDRSPRRSMSPMRQSEMGSFVQ